MPNGGRHPSARTGRSTNTPGGNSSDNYNPPIDWNVKSLTSRNYVSAGTNVSAGTTLNTNYFQVGANDYNGEGASNRLILPVVDLSSSYEWYNNPRLGEIFFESSGNKIWIGDLSGARDDTSSSVKWAHVSLTSSFNQS